MDKAAVKANQFPIGLVRGAGFAASLIASAYLVGLAQHSGYSVLGWFALLPLFHSIRVLPPIRAFAAGLLWGLSAFLLGASRSHPQVGLFAAGCLMSFTPAVYAALGSRLIRRIGFSPYLLALGWMGVEFSLHPLGMHNGLLAGTLGDQGFLVGVVGNFAGYVLIAFLVAYFNAALLVAISSATISSRGGRFAVRSTGPQRGVFASEVPFHPSYLIKRSQPRAPPVRVLVSA